MKCLLIGRSGQLARALLQLRLPEEIILHSLGSSNVDVRSRDSIADALERTEPDIVLNAAGYTLVDKAESELDLAMAINSDGAAVVGAVTAEFSIPVIHISSDYVFDGTKSSPYHESDEAFPLNAYGRSKLAGERRLAEANPNHIILRTSWLYAPHGTNFVRTMLTKGSGSRSVQCVEDQCGNPTYAPHLAEGIIAVASSLLASPRGFPRGAYHMAGSGGTTWLGFAQEIFRNAALYGMAPPNLEPINRRDLQLPAKRPPDSRLDTSKLSDTFGFALPDWRVGVRACVGRILGQVGGVDAGERV